MNGVVQIVHELAKTLGEPEAEPTPLDGGITNRNFRARLGGNDYVIRVPGKDTALLGIDRVAEREANERAAGLGIAPRVATMLTDPPCLVTEFVEGAEMAAEDLREPEVLARVADALDRFHSSDGELPTTFDSFRVVEDYASTATERGVQPPASFEEARGHAARIKAVLSGPEHDPVPCHNDLLAANFIRGEELIWIVDWEYAGMGDRYFDLGNFSVNNELDDAGQGALLRAYFGEEPDERRLATLHLFRFMSDFREAMWGVVQSGVSELDFDFDEYAGKHFERLHDAAADARFDEWLEQASGS
jgi:thiamine kinase-like enzyme